jgi:O-antigen ligase
MPVLLVLLGAAGMLWADVSWAERWEGLVSFSKLLTIPLLFVESSRSERAQGVFAAYLTACLGLLFASFLLVLWPSLPHTAPDAQPLRSRRCWRCSPTSSSSRTAGRRW